MCWIVVCVISRPSFSGFFSVVGCGTYVIARCFTSSFSATVFDIACGIGVTVFIFRDLSLGRGGSAGVRSFRYTLSFVRCGDGALASITLSVFDRTGLIGGELLDDIGLTGGELFNEVGLVGGVLSVLRGGVFLSLLGDRTTPLKVLVLTC
jgi:hypothetical protein